MESTSYIYNITVYSNSSEMPSPLDHDDEYYYYYESYDLTEHSYHNTDYMKYMNYRRIRRIVYGIILIMMIIIGLVGNVLVVFSSCRSRKHRDSAFYVFLVNLCVGSMVLLGFEFPLLLYQHVFSQPWKMGTAFCQFHGYVQHCAIYGTAYALVAVLLFGVLQVTIPERIVMMNNTCTASVICSIKWAIIMIANIPVWIGHGLYVEMEGRSFCYHRQVNDSRDRLQKYLIIHFVFAFALPCVMMVAMTTVLVLKALHILSRSHYGNINNGHHLQKHMAFMLTGLIVAYILCWGPTNITFLLIGFDFFNYSNFFRLAIISDVFMSMACANPFINPWIILTALHHELLPGRHHASVTIPHNHRICQNDTGTLISNGNVLDGEKHESLASSTTEMDLV